MSIGYIYDPYLTKHQCLEEDHPESPERIQAIYGELLKRGYLKRMTPVKSRYASKEELTLAHDPKYLQKLDKIFSWPEKTIQQSMATFNSVYANKFTLECAYLAAGSTIELVEQILNGHLQSGIAIVRPPGHHAAKNAASGFCIFNNIALAALKARDSGKKVVVVDFDVHYGDGSAQILKNQPDIFYFSIHRYDFGKFYPGTGKASKYPNIFNYPLDVHQAKDQDFLNIFHKKLIPKVQEINPDLILISAGFDAGAGDPLGGYAITPNGFAQMVSLLKEISPKIALVLEGGYNLQTIAESMAECTKVLLE